MASQRSVKVKVERRSWNQKEEDELIGCVKELEGTIYKQDGVFKGRYLIELERKMTLKLPNSKIQANPHIESKLKTWKKHYGTITTLLTYSGVGWNDKDKMVIMDDDSFWEEIARKDKNATSVRNKSFRLYDDWVEIFGQDRATGEHAETPLDVVEEIENQEEDKEIDENIAGVDGDATTVANKGKEKKIVEKKKRRRSGEDWESHMKALKEVVGTFSQDTNKNMELLATRIGADFDASEKRQKVNSVVRRLDLEKKDMLRASTLICKDQSYCDIFMSLPEDYQGDWVKMLLDGEL